MTGIQPKLCVKYVNDILMIIKIREVEKILVVINRIKFTEEYENNGKIRFLGM